MNTEEASDRRAGEALRLQVSEHGFKLAQLSTVQGSLQDIDRRVSDLDRRLAVMDVRLTDNTTITQAIRDAQIGGKVLIKVLTWMAAIAAAGGTVWGAIYQITHGGKLP